MSSKWNPKMSEVDMKPRVYNYNTFRSYQLINIYIISVKLHFWFCQFCEATPSTQNDAVYMRKQSVLTSCASPSLSSAFLRLTSVIILLEYHWFWLNKTKMYSVADLWKQNQLTGSDLVLQIPHILTRSLAAHEISCIENGV